MALCHLCSHAIGQSKLQGQGQCQGAGQCPLAGNTAKLPWKKEGFQSDMKDQEPYCNPPDQSL